MDATKVCLLITGASRGIGRKVAQIFSKDGSIGKQYAKGSKIILMATSMQGLEETKATITNPNLDISLITADLSNAEDVAKGTKEALDILGDPSQYSKAVLVNNAGTVGDITKSASELDDLQELTNYFNLNLASTIYLSGKFCKVFAGQDCLVVNISSKTALVPFPYMAMYCTGRAAREMYFRCLSVDNPDVSVLNYGPGPVATDMTRTIREKSGSDSTREFFTKIYEDNSILQPEVTIEKLARIIREKLFKSGNHVDFYDIE